MTPAIADPSIRPSRSPLTATTEAHAPRLRFGLLLLGLVLAVLLPFLGFGGLAAWHAVQGRQAAVEVRLLETAHGLALALDREIDRHLGIVRGLAAAEALDRPTPDLARFDAQARRVVGAFGTSAQLLDAVSLRPLVDTAVSSGAALDGAALTAFRPAVQIGLAVVTNVLADVGGRPAVGVGVPVLRDGQIRFVLLVWLDPEVVRRLLVNQTVSRDVSTAVIDSSGMVVARTDELNGDRLGQPSQAELLRVPAAHLGIYRATALDGTEHVVGYHRLGQAPGWTVVVGQLATSFDAAWRVPAFALGVGALLALLLGCILATVVARAVLNPVRRLEAHARALAESDRPLPIGSVAAIPPARVAELEALRQGFAAAEAAIAAREENLHLEAERVGLALAAGAIVGTWNWDLQTDHFAVDDRFAFYFGLDPALGRTGLSLEQVIATVHPEDLAGLRVAISGAISRGGAYAHQYRVRGRDGAYRWIEANGRVDLAPDGTPQRFPGVLLDIEAWRSLEAERDRSVAVLRAFVAAVPGVVYAKDLAGRMLVANEGVAALIGKPLEAILGHTDADFLDDQTQAAAVASNDRRIMDSGTAEQVEEEVNLPDGTPAVWLSTKAPFRDREGKIVGLIGSSIDITARIRAEAYLRESEARLRLASEAGGIGSFSCNLATGHTYWSEMMYRLYGLDGGLPPPSMSEHGEHLDLVHPDDRALLQAQRATAAADLNAVDFAFEFRIRRLDTGATRWIASRGEFVRNLAGGVELVRGVQQDITERRADADRLQLMVHELNHRVKNTLATVQSITAQSLRTTDPAVRRRLEGRILALAAAHDVLTREGWAGASMDEVVAGVLAPHGGRDSPRFRVSGLPLRLAPRAAVAISMALHELVTNALKYGALSVGTGHVELCWRVEPGLVPRVHLTWTERGGPPVETPVRPGFGARLIERSLAHDLGGTTRIDFRPEGVVCQVEAPLASVAAVAGVVKLPRVGKVGEI